MENIEKIKKIESRQASAFRYFLRLLQGRLRDEHATAEQLREIFVDIYQEAECDDCLESVSGVCSFHAAKHEATL